MARSDLPARATVRHDRRPTSCRPGSIATACSKSNGAPTSNHFRPDARRTAAVRARSGPHPVRVRRRVPVVARRRPSVGGARAAAPRGRPPLRRRLHRRRSRARGGRARRARRARRSRSPARCRTTSCRRRWRPRTSASRRSTRCATRRCGWASTGRRSRSSSTWRSACRSSRRRCRACAARRARSRGSALRSAEPRGLDRAIVSLADAAVRRRMGAAARARVVRDFSWEAHCAALDARLRAAGHVDERAAPRPDRHRLVPARLRRQRMEHVGARRAACWRAATTSKSSRSRSGSPAGVDRGQLRRSVPVTTFRRTAPDVPVVRNMVKNEAALARPGDVSDTRDDCAGRGVDIIHAQHVMTTVPSIRAGAATGMPVVATVRDYWPVCYWSDLIYDPSQPQLCPAARRA